MNQRVGRRSDTQPNSGWMSDDEMFKSAATNPA
jgi:hypothetical protein